MKKARTIRVGCRGTDFCRACNAAVVERLREAHPDVAFEIVDLPSDGDGHAILDALAAGVCDLHARGARELPVDLPEGVIVAACTQRTDPYDVLVTRDGSLLEDLPAGAVLGVESPRVRVQVARFRDDLHIRLMPETADRRYGLLDQGEIAGFIAAAEELETLGLQGAVSEVFPPDVILPAAGQGSVAVLAREGADGAGALARPLDHRLTHRIVDAERAFLRELRVEPSHPVAVHGRFDDDALVLEALLADEVSGAVLRDDLDGSPEEGADLGVRLAKLVLADGARDYLAGYR
jgi:hydroxymethylbilane synthase